MEVEPIAEPESIVMRQTLKNLREAGIKFLFGRWLVEGAPLVLLFDVGAVSWRMNEWKSDLWNVAGIPSPADDRETNDAIIFGYTVAWFLGEYMKISNDIVSRNVSFFYTQMVRSILNTNTHLLTVQRTLSHGPRHHRSLP
jgi:hypothetical protein